MKEITENCETQKVHKLPISSLKKGVYIPRSITFPSNFTPPRWMEYIWLSFPILWCPRDGIHSPRWMEYIWLSFPFLWCPRDGIHSTPLYRMYFTEVSSLMMPKRWDPLHLAGWNIFDWVFLCHDAQGMGSTPPCWKEYIWFNFPLLCCPRDVRRRHWWALMSTDDGHDHDHDQIRWNETEAFPYKKYLTTLTRGSVKSAY